MQPAVDGGLLPDQLRQVRPGAAAAPGCSSACQCRNSSWFAGAQGPSPKHAVDASTSSNAFFPTASTHERQHWRSSAEISGAAGAQCKPAPTCQDVTPPCSSPPCPSCAQQVMPTAQRVLHRGDRMHETLATTRSVVRCASLAQLQCRTNLDSCRAPDACANTRLHDGQPLQAA